MTRKVAPITLALSCAALLAPAGVTAAPSDALRAASPKQEIRSAASGPLTESSARRLALKLARQAARGRNVRWWQLSDRGAIAPNRVIFDYADRSRDSVYCTAAVVVSQPSSRTRRARFTDAECQGVPTEALRIESATARFIRGVAAEQADIRAVQNAVAREVRSCSSLRVPRSRLSDVRTLFAAWEAYKLIEAMSPIGGLAGELLEINPQRGGLTSAARDWRTIENQGFNIYMTLIARGETRTFARIPCPALREWARGGWKPDDNPAFTGDLRVELDRIAAAERGLARAASVLARLGVSPRVVAAFSGPAGVLAVAVPPFPIVCEGQQVNCPSPG